MYQKLPESDPDVLPEKASNTSFVPLIAILVIFLFIVFVIGIVVMAKTESTVLHNNGNIENESPIILSSSNVPNIESDEEVVTRPILTRERRPKLPDRIILEDDYLKVTDCSEKNEFYLQYLTLEPLPLNIRQNTTVNLQILMNRSLHWSTELEIELDKWFFGLPFLSMRIPCIKRFFGSCRFNLCDMLRLHWDEQFCTYLHNYYNSGCQCPDVFSNGVFTMYNWHYKPILKRIMKFFSFLARGWYNLRLKLFAKHTSTRPFSCYNVEFKLISKRIKG